MSTVFGEEFDHMKLPEQEWLGSDPHPTAPVLLVLCLVALQGIPGAVGHCWALLFPIPSPREGCDLLLPPFLPMDIMRHTPWFLTASCCTAGAIAEPGKVRRGYFTMRANHGLLMAFLYVILAILGS